MNQLIFRDSTEDCWLKFENPVQIFQTHSIDEVIPFLKRVEEIVVKKKLFAAGFLSYEASPAFDAAFKTFPADDFPLLCFGVFEKVEKIADLELDFSNFSKNPETVFKLLINAEEYQKKVSKIKHYLQKGDTYQVNFTFRQMADFQGDPIKLFFQIAHNSPFGAFVEMDDFAICSASPELFFKVQNGQITTRPMKGTAPRGRCNLEDSFYKNQLAQSQKDCSENVMIVDMIRNDLSKIAETGTVKTPFLFALEKYPTLWQMTSTVKAETRASFSEILTALFPCASITGAPKVRTMEIIHELENAPRKIYTGTLGYLFPDGKMQFNVAIRTVLVDKKKGRLEYGVGSGIVWKSNPEKEFEECLLKSEIIRYPERNVPFSLLETLLWEPKKGYFLLDKHLNRLLEAGKYFDYKIDLGRIQTTLSEITSSFSNRAFKVRLLVPKKGMSTIHYEPISTSNFYLKRKVILAKKPIVDSDPFLIHKTTNRQVYEEKKKDFPKFYDVLLWNEKGELTEFTNGNLVAQLDGELVTPPLSCGLLSGTFRSYLLDEKIISEKLIPLIALPEIEEIFFINSVRKWQKVELENTFKKLIQIRF